MASLETQGEKASLETQSEKAARNQSLFREVNERIDALALGGPILFLCECCDTGCTDSIEMLHGEYESVREHPARFVIKPSHEDHDVERVVERHPEYLVVEKVGEGKALAEALAPRRS